MKGLLTHRLRAIFGLIMIIASIITIGTSVATNRMKPEKLSVQYVSLQMRVNDTTTVWLQPTMNGFLINKELYVPIKWTQYAVLRAYRLEKDAEQVSFRLVNNQTSALLMKERTKWIQKSTKVNMKSKLSHVLGYPKSIKLFNEPSSKGVSTKGYLVNGGLYIPFRSLEKVFGGKWSWDQKTNVVNWLGSKSTNVLNPSPTIPVASTLDIPRVTEIDSIVTTIRPVLTATPSVAPTMSLVPTNTPVVTNNSKPNTVPAKAPTSTELNQDALAKIFKLQAECKNSLTSAYNKVKAAKTTADKVKYIALGKATVTSCDVKFDAILSSFKSSLVQYGYDTTIVTTYRNLYNSIKAEQKSAIE